MNSSQGQGVRFHGWDHSFVMIIISKLDSQPPHSQARWQQRATVQSMIGHRQWQTFSFCIFQDPQAKPQEQPVATIPAWLNEKKTSESKDHKEMESPSLFSLESSCVYVLWAIKLNKIWALSSRIKKYYLKDLEFHCPSIKGKFKSLLTTLLPL